MKLCYSRNNSRYRGAIMPIRASWGNEKKTYVVFTFEGKWTWEEYHRAIAEAFELVKDCTYTVNILIDLLDSHLFPQNLLSHFGSSMKQPPRAFDVAVIVTSSRFVEVLARTIEKLYGKQRTRFQVAKTLEEAERILVQFDASPASPPAPSDL